MANLYGPCEFSALDTYLALSIQSNNPPRVTWGFALSPLAIQVPMIKPCFGAVFIPTRLHQSEVLLWEPILNEEIATNPKSHVEDKTAKNIGSPLANLARLIMRRPQGELS